MQLKRLGKKSFVADSFKIKKNDKMVTGLSTKKFARDSFGSIKDVVVRKRKHSIGLVLKEYSDKKVQSKQAKNDFVLLSFLKKKGYPVPPTIRLVEKDGLHFVVMTDLTKFGDRIIKYFNNKRTFPHLYVLSNIEKLIGLKKTVELKKNIELLIEKARKEHNVDVSDAFEIVVDSRKRSARFFLVDVDDSSRKRKKQKQDLKNNY